MHVDMDVRTLTHIYLDKCHYWNWFQGEGEMEGGRKEAGGPTLRPHIRPERKIFLNEYVWGQNKYLYGSVLRDISFHNFEDDR